MYVYIFKEVIEVDLSMLPVVTTPIAYNPLVDGGIRGEDWNLTPDGVT